jgi:hypothetical protein
MSNLNPSPLTRFKPGVSGNPRGRPRGSSVTDRLRAHIDDVDADGSSRSEQLAITLYKLAREGDIRAIRTVLDRLEGKVTTPPPDPEGQQITFRIEYADDFPAPAGSLKGVGDFSDETDDQEEE